MNINDEYSKVYTEEMTEDLIVQLDTNLNDLDLAIRNFSPLNYPSSPESTSQMKKQLTEIKQLINPVDELKKEIHSRLEEIKKISVLIDDEKDLTEKAVLLFQKTNLENEYKASCFALAKQKIKIVKSFKIFGNSHNLFSSTEMKNFNDQILYFSQLIEKYKSDLKTNPEKRVNLFDSIYLQSITQIYKDTHKDYQIDQDNTEKIFSLIKQLDEPSLFDQNIDEIKKLYEDNNERLNELKVITSSIKKHQNAKDIKELIKEILKIEYEFKITNSAILAKEFIIIGQIEKINADLSNNGLKISNNQLDHIFDTCLEHNNQLTNDLKKIKKAINNLDLKSENTIEAIDKEIWPLTRWGQLITSDSGKKSKEESFLTNLFKSTVSNIKTFFYQIVNGSKDPIDSLKQQNRRLKAEIADKTIVDKDNKIDELNQNRRILYQTLLLRLVDVIGEKQRLIQNKSGLTKKMIEADVRELNHAYERIFDKLRSLPVKNSNLQETLLNNVTTTLSLGYLGNNLLSVGEIQTRKHYADLGYSMCTDVKLWAESLVIPPGKTWRDALRGEINSFLKWADKNPITASNLASDIALTCSLIQDDSFLDTFKKKMTAQAYSTAFLVAWGDLPKKELDTKEDLKYRALADLCRYAPLVVGVMQGVTQSTGVQNAIYKAAANVVKAHVIQQAARFIPSEYNDLAVAAISIVKGDDFRTIIETQRNIELAGLAGKVRQAFLDPTSALSSIKRTISIWWQSILRAKGTEKWTRVAIQIAIPAVSVIGIGALMAVAILGGPIGWAFVLTAGIAVAGLNGKIISWSNHYLNTMFPTYSVVSKEKLEQELHSKRQEMRKTIETNPDYKTAIRLEQKNFIKELIEKGSIPVVVRTQGSSTTAIIGTNQALINSIAEKTKASIEASLNKKIKEKKDQELKSATDYVKLYTEEINIEEIRKVIQTEIRKNDSTASDSKSLVLTEEILFQTIYSLLHNWLAPHIEEVMIEKCLDFASGDPDYLKQKLQAKAKIDLDKYLEEKLEENSEIDSYGPKEIKDFQAEMIKKGEKAQRIYSN